jgi:sugar phosphate permease
MQSNTTTIAADNPPTGDVTKPERITRIQVMTMAFLMSAGIVCFLDRTALSVANTTVRAELGLSATDIGMLLSAFSLAYAIGQLPAGVSLDKFGPRKILTIGMFCWSLAQMVMGVVSGFWTFFALRIGLGGFEAPFMLSGVKASNEWFPLRKRGLPMSLINLTIVTGSAIAPPLLTAIMLSFGWRSMFVILGVLGVVFSVIWGLFYRDRGARILSEDEVAYLDQHAAIVQETRISFAEWRGLFCQRSMWGMIIGFCGINYTTWLYAAWLPGYLQAVHHLTIAQTGWFAAIPFIFGGVGMLFNGAVADWLAGRGVSPGKSRRVLICIGMVCAAICCTLVIYVSTPMVAMLIMGAVLFSIHFAGTSAWGLPQVAAPQRMVASVCSIQNCGGFLFASLGPVIAGWFLDRTGSFDVSLLICAGVILLGALSYAFIVKEPIREPLLARSDEQH